MQEKKHNNNNNNQYERNTLPPPQPTTTDKTAGMHTVNNKVMVPTASSPFYFTLIHSAAI